jgi:hypothetical protein
MPMQPLALYLGRVSRYVAGVHHVDAKPATFSMDHQRKPFNWDPDCNQATNMSYSVDSQNRVMQCFLCILWLEPVPGSPKLLA